MKTTKEAWTIHETTYEGTKKVKDTKLQMLTTRFEELKMGDDEAFDSFYGKLNEIVIAKLNLGENIEDSKVVRKILRSLPESFRAKVIAIEERVKTWMISKSKNLLDLSKNMSWDCLFINRANHLLLKPSLREWTTPLKRMMWRRRYHSLLSTSENS